MPARRLMAATVDATVNAGPTPGAAGPTGGVTPRAWLVAVSAALLLGAVSTARAEQGGSLAEVDALVDAGAPGLALAVVNRYQPFFRFDGAAWEQWERRRLRLYADAQRWASLVARLAQHPEETSSDFQRFALELGAGAHLALGDGAGAGDAYARLIWGSAGEAGRAPAGGDDLTRWRAGLAHAYLLAKRLEDARTATLRYRLDYGEDPPGWRLAHGEALLRSGYDAEAREQLAGLDDPRADFLALLVLARDSGMDPDTLLLEAAPSLDDRSLEGDQRAQLWAALAGVAARYRDHEVRVTAMEQALALGAPGNPGERFVAIDPDGLWEAYDAYATVLANRAHLLVGRFDSWLALADELAASDPLKARALYAHLSSSGDASIAGRAQRGLLSSLAEEQRGLRVLAGLYLESRRYPRPEVVPAPALVPLLAGTRGEFRKALAARLSADVIASERSAIPDPWRAPVSLALIAEGRSEAAALVASDMTAAGFTTVSGREGAVRVALALLSAGEADAAQDLLTRALAVPGAARDRRLLYALALVDQGTGDHREAARLFLGLAGGDASTVGAWSTLATVEAARSLTRAGLREDALGVLAAALGGDPRGEGDAVMEHLLARP